MGVALSMYVLRTRKSNRARPARLSNGAACQPAPVNHDNGGPAMPASTDSSATDVDSGCENDAPQVSALFLIKFDKKIGYVWRWCNSPREAVR